jgi:hypothetical protein
MRSAVAFHILGFAAAAMAFPGGLSSRAVKPWVAPASSDSRSPCPGLNVLANHGYLPHDGLQVTVDQIANAAAEGFHVQAELVHGIATALFAALGPNTTIIDLEDLNAHNKTEVRASTTRLDAPGGDSLHVNLPRLKALLDDSDTDFVTIPSLAKSRKRIEALTPGVTEGEIDGGIGTAGLLMLITSDDTSFQNGDFGLVEAPKVVVEPWLAQERLAVEKGWRRPATERTAADFEALKEAIMEARAAL